MKIYIIKEKVILHKVKLYPKKYDYLFCVPVKVIKVISPKLIVPLLSRLKSTLTS